MRQSVKQIFISLLTVNTKHLCNIYAMSAASSTLVQYFTNVIKMFCAYNGKNAGKCSVVNTHIWQFSFKPFKHSRCIKALFDIPENRLNFPTTSGFRTRISMKLVYQYIGNFFNFQTTSNHLHPLQVENCNSNSRLVVDEDDNGKFRPERVKRGSGFIS